MPLGSSQSEPPDELLTLAEYRYKLSRQVSFLAGDTLLTGPPVLIPPPSGGGRFSWGQLRPVR